MAPEQLKNGFYWNKADIWSFGVIVYYIISGSSKEISLPSPFSEGLITEPKYTNPIIEKAGLIPLPEIAISKNLMDFLSKCLRIEPHSRLSVDHALNHPFINKETPNYLN